MFTLSTSQIILIAGVIIMLFSIIGIVIAAVSSSITGKKLKKQLEKGFAGYKHHYLNLKQLPADFAVNQADQSSNYLKVFTIKVEK